MGPRRAQSGQALGPRSPPASGVAAAAEVRAPGNLQGPGAEEFILLPRSTELSRAASKQLSPAKGWRPTQVPASGGDTEGKASARL